MRISSIVRGLFGDPFGLFTVSVKVSPFFNVTVIFVIRSLWATFGKSWTRSIRDI